ncbi:MAG: DNA methyltransferase [Acidimicrobiia bacterium]
MREARTGYYAVKLGNNDFLPGSGEWKTNREGMARLIAAGRVAQTGRSLAYVRYLDDFAAFPYGNLWDDTQSGSGMDKVYVVQTNTKVIERCMLMTTDPGDLVLDPTCGSGTTAFVAEEWGRRWITTDTSRVALALARTRLMSARFPYYLLADSEEGAIKEALSSSHAATGPFAADVRKGFVYKRVPHITLKSIAQNPDIAEGMPRWEIEASIARHGESEVLVDQPYEDRRVRVAGRFTVESLSPHRMLEPDDVDQALAAEPEVVQFETMMLDNLRKAGVQNTFKGERLQFDRLEPLAGHQWLQAEGEYTEADETVRRVAVSIGPEFGTVGSEQVALAAQEATRRIPYDVVLVTGFAFDPQAWAKAKEINPDVAERSLGRLRVLLVRANPDLAMGGELLKKTGAGNLFSIFGEPDIDIRTADGQVVVEIRGLDVYDPTTGVVRSASTDDIACWFIDTNYDGTSFFVRHAYFTGGQQPYENLAKTLRAEIDPDAWATLYSTVSRPFPLPATGRVAVKVINHYGDEVLQVYDVTPPPA